jgi:hypothetical protein
LPPTFLGYAHFSEHPYYSYGGHLYIIPPAEGEYTNFKVSPPDEEVVLYSRGGHNYYGARDMERLQRRLKGIFTDIVPNPPTSSPLGSQLPILRSISDGANRFKSRRIGGHSRPLEKRGASLPGEAVQSQYFSSPDDADEAVDTEGLSNPEPPDVTTNLGVEHHGKSWMEGYLERERTEEAAWEKKTGSQSVWGALHRAVSLGVFKKPQQA